MRQKSNKATSPGIYPVGKATKRALLEATLRIIARQGMWAVTHRAVAAEADAALRTTTYYFATKQELISEAFRFFNEQELQRLEDVKQKHKLVESQSLEKSIEALAEVVEIELADIDQIVAAEFELILYIARDPTYAPEYDKVQEVLHQRSVERMKALGAKNPDQLARIVLAYVRGYQLLSLAQPDRPLDIATFKADLLAIVKGHLD